jgi:hypothetical protein
MPRVLHRIALPTSFRAHTLKAVLERVCFFPDEDPAGFDLQFNRSYEYMEPVAVAMLGAWGSYWQKKRVTIRCDDPPAKGVAYAKRMGLFNFIRAKGLPDLKGHEPAGRFLELRRIEDQRSLTRTIGDIAAIVRVKHLIEIVQYVLSELTRNVLEHARSEAYVCAQYYPTPKRVSIGIADCGVGILQSLRQSYSFGTHSDAIVAALKPLVSGTSRVGYGSPDNAGLGLFYARGLAKLSKEYFVIHSGSAAYRQLKSSSEGKAENPERDPTQERHHLWTALHPWQGTVVSIDIRGMEQSFSSVSAALRSMNPSMRVNETEVRNRIRFTT